MINCKEIKKSIQLKTSSLKILKEITFKAAEDSITVLYGKSGSGKTTLLHILSGLDLPTSGKCLIDSTDIAALSVDARATFRLQHIGMVYQFFNLIPNLTLYENIKLPLILDNKKIDNSYIREVASYLGIIHIMGQFPTECSGGELQRATFARAMINKPKIIVADEPTGNLDSENRSKMLSLIKNLNKDFNITFFIATHDNQFKDIATSVIEIKDGAIHH